MKSEPIITPLFLATSQEYIAGVDALMEAGVNPKDVEACIQHAYTKGKLPVMQRLVSDLEQPVELLLSLSEKVATSPGQSRISTEALFNCFPWNRNNIPVAMQRVIGQNRLQSVLLKLLIDRFFHLNQGPQKETAEQLIDVLKPPLDHCAFFSHSSHGNHSKAIKILLQAGASFSSFNPDGCTPLQIDMITAILTNSESDLSMVLNQQTDLVSSKLPPLDRTPLHFAAETGCTSSVLVLLVNRGADLEAEDKDGKTPVQVATKEIHQRLINIGARWRA